MSGTTSAASRLQWARRWSDLALQHLGAVREEVDALNVYPVPDGDTGTNLYLTLEAARAALYDAGLDDEVAALRALSRGALLGARGNSGVILSELIRAVTRHLADAGEADADTWAQALVAAADAGYA
ncbi:MAG: DAK2 domain-containing protein, partial [Nocardioidaceae bacterium]